MGAPEKYVKWVEKLRGDFEVMIKVGKEEIAIRHSCKVRKGDNLSPTLLIISMWLVAQCMLAKLKSDNISLPSAMYNNVFEGALYLHKETH